MNSVPWVDFSIERGPVYKGNSLTSKIGLRIRIHCRQELEEFMRGLSKNKRVPITAYAEGETWLNVGGDFPLDVYAIDFGHNNKAYTLAAVGGPLFINDDDGGIRVRTAEQNRTVNLSFLTLAGISADEGITIGLPGAFSADYIHSARNLVPQAIKQFLSDYVVPMTINLSIVSKN